PGSRSSIKRCELLCQIHGSLGCEGRDQGRRARALLAAPPICTAARTPQPAIIIKQATDNHTKNDDVVAQDAAMGRLGASQHL
ncbi:MAG: hypothetical protein ACKPKO_07455, partial [Candidatus Fonsibacter sp.]